MSTQDTPQPEHDPSCYLCPGNERVNGITNPNYSGTFSFPNDFPALNRESASMGSNHTLFRAEPISGECRVLCYSHRHNATLSTLSMEELRNVIALWVDTCVSLSKHFPWVQIFENKGQIMGMSSPHPHGQAWAMSSIPTLVQKEDTSQTDYFRETGRPMLLDVVEAELNSGTRVVTENDDWAWLVPFWAVWPFEVLLLPKKQITRFDDLAVRERTSLANILSDGLKRYDRLFNCPFPYSMGWHFAPYDSDPAPWMLHAHFYPPLLRSSSVRKFMVGFEMLSEAQRDLTPEEAAGRLRNT